MRTYGEGFIIVDQSPTAVDVSAVKNTNTKIIMRLPDYEDCKIAGLSMGLNDSQIREISRFPMGVAVVYQNNWVEAVLTQIDKSEEQYHQTDLITDDYALAVIKGQLAVELVFQYETGLAAEEGFQLPNNFYLLMMMIELVFVGAYKILVNLIPHKTNGVPNDGYIVKMLDAHIAMRKDYALYLRIYADTFLNKAISPSDYQYERNESLSDDELLYYNEIQEILKSINAQMSKHEIDHCKGIVI